MVLYKHQIILYKLIIFLKKNQNKRILKCINTNLIKCQLDEIKSIFRTINRTRQKNISDDIINFSKLIKQELININNRLLNHDIFIFFKHYFKHINSIDPKTCYSILDILDYQLYDIYYVDLCYIKSMFIIKSKEFSYIIKYCASSAESELWKTTFYELKNFILQKMNEFNDINKYLKNKLINMYLINNLTRTYFDIRDDININDNKIIIKLQQINKIPIINIIESFINKEDKLTNWLTYHNDNDNSFDVDLNLIFL